MKKCIKINKNLAVPAVGILIAGLALFVGGLDEEHLNFALATPEGTHALRVKMSITRHSLAVRQEMCAMMALNMLRRWLNGKEVASEHGWINVVESLFVE